MDFFTAAIIQGLGYSVMGVGIYLSLRVFNIPDITTDGSFTLGGSLAAVGIVAGYHPLLVLLFSVAGGVLAGTATGLIHTRMAVNPLLAGILVMTALYSVNLSIMGRSNIPLLDDNTLFDKWNFTGTDSYDRWIIILIFVCAVLILISRMLRTDFGIGMRATGDNEHMARASGVNTNSMKITGLAIANLLTALSGYLMVQYQGFSDINMGIGIVISGLASVMIGESIAGIFKINRIWFHLVMVVAGSVVFRLVLAVALTTGLNPNYLKLVTALIVLAVMATGKIKLRTA